MPLSQCRARNARRSLRNRQADDPRTQKRASSPYNGRNAQALRCHWREHPNGADYQIGSQAEHWDLMRRKVSSILTSRCSSHKRVNTLPPVGRLLPTAPRWQATLLEQLGADEYCGSCRVAARLLEPAAVGQGIRDGRNPRLSRSSPIPRGRPAATAIRRPHRRDPIRTHGAPRGPVTRENAPASEAVDYPPGTSRRLVMMLTPP